MLRVGVLVSGGGTNLQAILDAVDHGDITNAEVSVVISKNPGAYALERARKHGIRAVCISPKQFPARDAFNQAFLAKIDEYDLDLIVLAGFLVMIPAAMTEKYKGRIINIHPSLLPAFPGLHGIRDAFEAGVKETGVTIHYIDQGVDTGPIIRQEKVRIEQEDTFDSLKEKIHRVEHRIYPEVISEIIENGGYLK